MYINPISIQKSSFTGTINNNSKYKQVSEKKAYIDAKTQDLENLAVLGFIGALLNGVYSSKTIKPSKISSGLIILSIGLLIAKWIKQIKLSKEYDREVKNDSKNNTGSEF